jgi:O-antigen/teichoic acid export membrane protein
MSKAGDIAKVSTTGSFHVLWGMVISSAISAVGAIFIARLLGSDLYGLYAIVLTVPSSIQIFRDWGINYAIVRFTAQYRAEGRIDEIRSVCLAGVFLEVMIGLFLSLFSFVFADFLAVSVFNRPIIAPLIQIASFSIFANGLVTAAGAAFTGYEKMEFNSVMLIGQSIAKTGIIIILVVLGLGTAGATIGFSAGTFIAGIIGVMLIWTIYRRLPKPAANKLQIKAYLITMLTYCLPLSFTVVITALLPQFYAFLLPIYYPVDNVPIGNYNVALNFVVLIAFVVTPIQTMLFPAFSKLDAKRDSLALGDVFRFSVKYSALLVVPTTVLVMCLAEPGVETLFGSTYALAPLYLALFAIQYLYVAFGNLSVNGLLNGQGQTGYMLRMGVLTGLFGFPLGYVLIMNFGVLGLIVSTLLMGLPSLFLELRFIKKTYGFVVDWVSSAKVLFSSAVAGVLTYLLVSNLPFASWLLLVIGAPFFVLVAVAALLLTRSITRSDVAALRSMVSGLGAFSRIIDKLLGLLDRLIVLINRNFSF